MDKETPINVAAKEINLVRNKLKLPLILMVPQNKDNREDNLVLDRTSLIKETVRDSQVSSEVKEILVREELEETNEDKLKLPLMIMAPQNKDNREDNWVLDRTNLIKEIVRDSQGSLEVREELEEANKDRIKVLIIVMEPQDRGLAYLVRTILVLRAAEVLETTIRSLVRIREDRIPVALMVESFLVSLALQRQSVQLLIDSCHHLKPTRLQMLTLNMELLDVQDKMLKVADQDRMLKVDKLATGDFLMPAIVLLLKVFSQEQILLGSPSLLLIQRILKEISNMRIPLFVLEEP